MGKKKGKGGDEPKKQKVVVDKTFGLKNKKGAATQKMISMRGYNAQAKHEQKQKETKQLDKKKLRAAKEAEAKFLASFGYKAPEKKKKPPPKKKEDTPEDAENADGGDDAAAAAGPKDGVANPLKIGDGKPKIVEQVVEEESDSEDEIIQTLEELIEIARKDMLAKLKPGQTLTPVNETTFKAWKKRKIQEKRKALAAEQKKTKKNLESGKLSGISGRQMFQMGAGASLDLDVSVAAETTDADEHAVDVTALRKEAAEDPAGDANGDQDDGQPATEIDEGLFAMDLGDLDLENGDENDDITAAIERAAASEAAAKATPAPEKPKKGKGKGKDKGKDNGDNVPASSPPNKEETSAVAASSAPPVTSAASVDAPSVKVDTDLFASEDLGDLDIGDLSDSD